MSTKKKRKLDFFFRLSESNSVGVYPVVASFSPSLLTSFLAHFSIRFDPREKK